MVPLGAVLLLILFITADVLVRFMMRRQQEAKLKKELVH